MWASLRPVGAPDLALLSSDEQSRADAIHGREAHRRFVLATVLLRRAVGVATGVSPKSVSIDRRCSRCGRHHGRPRLPDSALYASITHAGDVVGVAVTPAGPVGLDVESSGDRDLRSIEDLVLAPEERRGAPDDFYRYWTRKEAIVKATGDGIGIGLASVVVSDPVESPRLIRYGGRHGLAAGMRDLAPLPGHPAALAVRTSSEVHVIEVWTDGFGSAMGNSVRIAAPADTEARCLG
jgi:4'-phosphopantetheinyl transferase